MGGARFLVWAAPFLILLFARQAFAEASFRTVVRVSSPSDSALLERVRGQSNDLDLEIIEVAATQVEERLHEQLEAADALSTRYHARLVVWFDTSGDNRVLVYFLVPETQRVLVRVVGGTGERTAAGAPSSATLEAAALVVRSAVRALAAGATIGVTRAEALDEPPAPPRDAPPAPLATAVSEPVRPSISVGWQGALVGAGPVLVHALAMRLGLLRARLDVALALSVGVPTHLDDRYATVALSRHAVALSGGYAVVASERLRVVIGLELGAASFVRSTVSAAPNVSPQPEHWSISPLAGPTVALSYGVPWLGASWGLAAWAAVDVVPAAPLVGYDILGHFEAEHDLWFVQPTAQLALDVIFQ